MSSSLSPVSPTSHLAGVGLGSSAFDCPTRSSQTPISVKTRDSFPHLVLALLLASTFIASCYNSDQPTAASGGENRDLVLEGMVWGRLVNIVDETGVLMDTDVLVNPGLSIDGLLFDLSLNPVTQAETLHILAAGGSQAYQSLFEQATGSAGLEVVDPKGDTYPPPYSMVPRNGVLRLQFSAPLDPDTVGPSSIQILSGNPATLPFNLRYFVKNDSTGTDNDKGYVFLDPTISLRDSANFGLPTNSQGFPASFDSSNDNLLIRIPTEKDLLFGQAVVVTNLSGTRTFKVTSSEPSASAPNNSPIAIRVLRTGNLDDEYNGFLQDLVPPTLIGVQSITADIEFQSGTSYEIVFSIDASWCQNLSSKIGDVFEFQGSVFLSTALLAPDPLNPGTRVMATLIDGSVSGNLVDQGGRLNTRYSQEDSALQVCYIEISPPPVVTLGQPLQLDPLSTTFTLKFSEPIDPLTISSMHSIVLTAYETDEATYAPEVLYFRHSSLANPNESVADYIDRQRGFDLMVDNSGTIATSERGGRVLFGPIQFGQEGRTFTLAPSMGLAEPNPGSGDTFLGFSLALRSGSDGVRDLAGHPLALTGFVAGAPGLSASEQLFTATGGGGASATVQSKSLTLRGIGIDENQDGLPEYAGQFGFTPGVLTGRSPDRFSRDADSSNLYVGQQTPIPSAITNPPKPNAPYEPLNPAGSVVMTCLRAHDLGFGYLNAGEYDVDIAGLNWAPMGGVVFDESYARFSVALSHAKFMPDEVISPITGMPVYPNSGLNLSGNFDENILGFEHKDLNGQPLHDEKIVYDNLYALRRQNTFVGGSNNVMLPWPSFNSTYTWRDTSISPSIMGGAAQSIGSPPILWLTDNGLGAAIWNPELVPSVGLPLLTRFRTYPEGEKIGVNTFQVTQMVRLSQLPAFRIYSAGGQDASGDWHQVIPDHQGSGGTTPVGGYNSNGARTDAFDPYVYWSEVDFVMRVSRVFTHWFDLGSALKAGDALDIQLEPEPENQEEGTGVLVELRGAVQVSHGGDPTAVPSPLTDASTDFDNFGEYSLIGIGGVSTPGDWTTELSDLEDNQYRYIQLRLTFINNTDAGLLGRMDGLGLSWNP